MHPESGLASMGQVVRRLLELYGVDAVALARRAGVDLAAVPAPDERIAADKLDVILLAALPLIDDPAFGLQAARCWHPSNLGVLGHAWLASSTLRAGLRRLATYMRLVGERAETRVEEVPQGVKVVFRRRSADAAVAAALADFGLALLLDMCRLNAGAALRPLAVSLCRPRPPARGVYEGFFGCTVRFGADENAFVLAARDADRLLPTSNVQLATVFDRLLVEELARLDRSDVVARCRAAVLRHLASGEISAEEAARQLNMSARTLQRKLAEARTSYQQLVENTRKDLALRYIEDPRRSVTDITFELGFSQPSAFTRAFRRWTGFTPSEYQARLARRPSAA